MDAGHVNNIDMAMTDLTGRRKKHHLSVETKPWIVERFGKPMPFLTDAEVDEALDGPEPKGSRIYGYNDWQ